MCARRLLLLVALLAGSPAAAETVCDATWRDGPRGRDLPVRIRMPEGTGLVPAVLWSPGLGGTRGAGAVWAGGWAAAGIAVIQLEHPGSDAAVYAGAASAEERQARVRAAATPAQLVARAGDVGFVADELARRRREGACDLSRIDPDRLGLAGHSMGAWTVQAIAGQRFGTDTPPPLVDRRFRAFIAMSPSATSPAGFADVHRPLLAITGTRDGVPAGADAAAAARALAQRTALFAALPADGRKAQGLFAGADHLVFAGTSRRADDAAGLRVQAATLAISTAWWRRWLLGDVAADAVLARPPLSPADRWERK